MILFVNITEAVHARNALHQANDLLRLAVVVRDAHDAVTVQGVSSRNGKNRTLRLSEQG